MKSFKQISEAISPGTPQAKDAVNKALEAVGTMVKAFAGDKKNQKKAKAIDDKLMKFVQHLNNPK